MAIKRLDGTDRFIGRAMPVDIDDLSVAGNEGVLAYGPQESDPLLPDLRIVHQGVKHRILTADPSSAGEPLQIVNSPFTITVHHDPSEQADYTTIRDALLYCAQFFRPPDLTTLLGKILVKSGHIERAQTQLSNVDLRWVELESEDNDVILDSTAMLGDPYFGGGGNALWLMSNCELPILKIHFVNDEVRTNYITGFNLSNCSFTIPPRDPDYYSQVDLNGVPGKRYGCSGFDINLIAGGITGGRLMPSAKFSNCRRDENVVIGSNASLSLYGGDYTGYRAQASFRVGGGLYISTLPGSVEGDNPFNTGLVGFETYSHPPDFRKNPGGPPAPHDIMLVSPGASLGRRGEFLGTCNVPVNTSVYGYGGHFFHESVRNPRMLEVDMLAFETYTRKELLPPAGAYRNAIALVKEGYQDDGVGANTLYVSDNGEWLPIRGGGLSIPNPPTFTDNGDGTFTLT